MTLRPLIAYFPWLARDLATRALVPLFILLIIGGLPLYGVLSREAVVDFANNAQQADAVRQVYLGVAPLAIAFGAFLVMTQSVALDRDRQHVRFLFAHQVSPTAFYLARFLLGIIVFSTIFITVPLTIELTMVDISVLGALAAYALQLLLVGAFAVLCASLTQRDGLALVIGYFIVRTLQQLSAADALANWADPLVKALPPFETLNAVVRALLAGKDVEWMPVLHVSGYGIGLLAVALVIIRRASLVR